MTELTDLMPKVLGAIGVATTFQDRAGDFLTKNPIVMPAGDETGAASNTVATLTAIGANPTNGYTVFQTDDYPVDGTLFKIFGGVRGARDDGYPNQGWRAVANTQADGTKRYDSGRVAFLTDAPSFDIWGPISTQAPIRVLVDGVYITRSPTFSSRTGGGYYDWFHVALPAGAPRRFRRIDFEFNYQEGSFRGIALPAGYIPQPIDQSGIYRIAFLGDSLGEGTGTQMAHDSAAAVAGYMLGGVDLDMVLMSIGGTGYKNPGPVNTPLIGHINDLASQHYDEAWIAMGINDSSYSASDITAAALLAFQTARSLLPGKPIVVVGVARDDSQTAQNTEAAIQAAFASWNDPHSAFIPLQTVGAKLFTGNNTTDTPASNFSNKIYGGGIAGNDNTHPNTEGHTHYGKYLAKMRRRIAL